MRLLFSEARPDYAQYVFPYAVWGFPDQGEKPSDFFDRGFLPSSRELDRFYLCRQVRVVVGRYHPSSENRRVLRKGEGIEARLVPRNEFEFTSERREFFKRYADSRYGADVMTYDRLDSLFTSQITTHALVFADTATGKEVGVVTLYLEGDAVAYYYHAFYDLAYLSRNLGMYMMTSAVGLFTSRNCRHLYLGSCYRPAALYKTQFAGAEFFNGVRWSDNIEELKYLVRRGDSGETGHLLESEAYRAEYLPGPLADVAVRCGFPVSNK